MANDSRSNFSRVQSWRSSVFLITLMVVVAVFVDDFIYGVIIPVLPFILKRRIHIETHISFWVSVLLAVYNAAVLVFAPIFGILTDVWENRKLPLLFGLVALIGSTLMFMLGRSIAVLAVARALQGISGSAVWAAGLALLVNTVGSEQAGFAMGWVAFAVSAGSTIGPVVGGIVYFQAGHNAVFLMACGLLVLELLLRLFILEKKARPGMEEGTAREQQPLVRRRSSSASQAPKNELAVMLLLLKSPEILLGLFAIFITFTIQRSIETILPIFAAEQFGWSSQGSGILFLAVTIPLLLGPAFGYIRDRYGSKLPTLIGFGLMAIGLACLCFVQQNNTGNIVLLCALLSVIGLGLSAVTAPQFSNVATYTEMKEKENPGMFGSGGATAQSCALIHVVQAVAGILGPLAASWMFQGLGWAGMNVVLAVLSFVAFFPVLRFGG